MFDKRSLPWDLVLCSSEVKDISYNRLFFGRSKFLVIRLYLGSKRDSIKPIREPLMLYVKGRGSASYALKLA